MTVFRSAFAAVLMMAVHITHSQVILDYFQTSGRNKNANGFGLAHSGTGVHRLNFGILLSPEGGSWKETIPYEMAVNSNAAIYLSLITILPGPFTIDLVPSWIDDGKSKPFTLDLTSSGQYGIVVPISKILAPNQRFRELVLRGSGVCITRIELLPNGPQLISSQYPNNVAEDRGIIWLYPDPATDNFRVDDKSHQMTVRPRVPEPDDGTLHKIFKGYVFQAPDIKSVVESKRVIMMLQKEMVMDTDQTKIIRFRRSKVFNYAYQDIMSADPKQLKNALCVEFVGDRQGNGGYKGVSSKDPKNIAMFFKMVYEELFNPEMGLFDFDRQHGQFKIHPSSDSTQQRYFRFAGRMIGLAIFNNVPMHVYFTVPMYKQLMSQEITLQDMRYVDMKQYRVLNWIVEAGDSAGFEKRTPNVEAHVDQLWRSTMIENTHPQMKALKDGLYEIIPLRVLSALIAEPQELEFLIGGQMALDLDTWRKFHTMVSGYTPSSYNQIAWFWHCMSGWDDDKIIELVKFVTGVASFVLPTNGVIPWNRAFVLSFAEDLPTDSAVKVNTFSNTLYMPMYSSNKIMCTELWRAVQSHPSPS